MVTAGQRDRLITVQRGTEVDDGYTVTTDWSAPTTVEQAWARVRYGPAGEKRQAAQETAAQTATFEVTPTAALRGVKLTDRIVFDGSNWDLTEKADLDRHTLRFTAVRSI